MRRRSEPRENAFPIVGIGASAGGLEAMELFLSNVPADSGMAFIIVQHLDPTRKGMLPDLLQRSTSMQVHLAEDRLVLQPDRVYVIPPNKDMSVLHGVIYLFEPLGARGLRLPIDFFLRSLAEDLGHWGIAVILSGMGADGTLGVRAIKEHAGLVLVQDPAQAKFDSMPRSVIDSGLADIVAPAEELPARIVANVQHGQTMSAGGKSSASPQAALEQAVILLRSHSGHDFSQYKKSTVYRRIERRMGIHQIDTLESYVRFLRENPQEVDLLFQELLIGVTNFFRDPAAWLSLQAKGFAALFDANPKGRALRAWVPACSTGEEAYTLAMCFKEALETHAPTGRFTLQIFATDLHPQSVNRARSGGYTSKIATDVSAERLERFFIEEGTGYTIKKEIREMVTFAPHDVILDPPFTRLDIITCRNLLIYFDHDLQAKLIPLFHYSLRRDGFLMLGSAETVGNFNDLFAQVDPNSRLYRRIGDASRQPALEFPTRGRAGAGGAANYDRPAPSATTLQSLADQALLQRFAPAAVLVNVQGDILYISGRTGKYLEPASGKANWNIHAMAREGLRNELSTALGKAVREKTTVNAETVTLQLEAATQRVALTAHYLDSPEALAGTVMLVFVDMPPIAGIQPTTPTRSRRVAEFERALQDALSESRMHREEMQSSQEELKSSNEELQSTNEELSTSKEEMQSMNEELQMVNQELQARVDDLAWASNDMENLLNSTDIATVFLTSALNVRRFTRRAQRVFKLLPGDVGRPLSDISNALHYPDLLSDASDVLHSLLSLEKQIPASEDRWFSVRIMPYRAMNNAVDGVVMTFSEITESKRLEAQLRNAVSATDKGA